MATKTTPGRQPDFVSQFSVFTANRLGRLHDLVTLLASRSVHVLALTVLDTTDSSIIRIIVDDPESTRTLLAEHSFPFIEAPVLVVELASTTDLKPLMAALLEAELNVNYLYSFIPHPDGKSILALNMEDNEMAEQALKRHQFRVLRQTDLSR